MQRPSISGVNNPNPGFEGVGVVEEVGPEVTSLRVGQRVLPLGSAGGWQTFKGLPAEWCVPVPDDLTDNQAATTYVNPLTAHLMLRSIRPRPGGLFGVNAANSAIGRVLIRMLHASGAKPVAVVRSAKSKILVDAEPVSAVFIEGAPLPLLDGGFDAVGGESGLAMAAAIKPGGLFLHYGLLSGVPLPHKLGMQVSAEAHFFRLRDWVHSVGRPELHAVMAKVFQDVHSGISETVVAASYPLAKIGAALAHNDRPNRSGKVLLVPA